MSEVVYDAAILLAADRNDRRTWAEHKGPGSFCPRPFAGIAVFRIGGPR
jgi:hypothetical protein